MSRVGLFGAAFSVAVAAWSVNVHAATTKGSPFGNAPVSVRIGSDPEGQWIGWQNQTTGECAWDWIGDTTGINDDYLVASGQGNDSLVVQTTLATFCGYPIGIPRYNGHVLDLYGYGGNDFLSSPTTLNTSIFGGEGNDWITSGNGIATLKGFNGDDLILASGSGFGGRYYGEAGNDCLFIKPTLAPALMTCGDGTADRWSGPGTRPATCEITETHCCGFCL